MEAPQKQWTENQREPIKRGRVMPIKMKTFHSNKIYQRTESTHMQQSQQHNCGFISTKYVTVYEYHEKMLQSERHMTHTSWCLSILPFAHNSYTWMNIVWYIIVWYIIHWLHQNGPVFQYHALTLTPHNTHTFLLSYSVGIPIVLTIGSPYCPNSLLNPLPTYSKDLNSDIKIDELNS